jgi:glyoxylase-like metal-dependent hydrolase (beta-lactamase superfamily II)
MKRTVVLGILVAVGALSMSVSALQQPAGQAQARNVEIEKLKDNFFVMRGGGGNSGVFITNDGVIVVDTKNPGWGQPLLDAIRKVTDKPVRTIINTHTHGDHVSGNVEFPANVEVVTHVNTAENMKQMRTPTGITPQPGAPANIFAEHKGHGLPKRTFADTLTLGRGDDRVQLRYFGRGHTNGDAWVFFPALRIVHAGDIFSGKNLPLLDANNGGSGAQIGDTLAKAADAMNDIDSVITGHSTVMKVADLREYAEFNRDFLAAVQAGRKAGRSAEEIAKGWSLPAKYTGYNVAPARVQTNVEVILKEIP